MRKFIFKFILFFLPVSLPFGIYLILPFYTGETVPLRQIVELQQESDEPIIFGRAYRDNFVAYKLIGVEIRQPDVLILGSSRTMQFREQLLNRNPRAFFNAGGSANNIFEMYNFLRQLDEGDLPQVLIVGLDQDWFHPRNAQFAYDRGVAPIDYEETPSLERVLNASRNIVVDLMRKRLIWDWLTKQKTPVHQWRAIGIRAMMATGGSFRPDGSTLPPDKYPPDLAFTEMRGRMQTGDSRFEYSDQFSDLATAELEKILIFCAEHNIQVIGFSPPYPPAIYNEMMASGHYGYIPAMASAFEELFVAYGFNYFNFSDGVFPGTSDENYFDGLHGSEFIYLKMYLHMLENAPEVLSPYSDLEVLEAIAEQPRLNDFDAFQE